jgi:glycosyltransferase involved in cell wall biosynthesis
MAFRKKNSKDLILSIIAHPLTIAPRPMNSAIIFGQEGYSVLLIGYRNENQKKFETLGKGAKIFRISLKSRRIKVGAIRQLFSVLEFVIVATKLINRTSPKFIILFNEIANIILRFSTTNAIKISWLLEFPEKYNHSIGESLMHWISIKTWKNADAYVFPTITRKAMAAVLEPTIISKPSFIVHNTPLPIEIPIPTTTSENGNSARSQLKKWKESGKIIIIYAGAVGNRYGWDTLIRTVANLENPYRLMIFGKKHPLGIGEFTEAIKDTKFPTNIVWVDSVHYFELNSLISMGDIGFVHYLGDNLNTYFSSPGKLYEYLKSGLAILTDVEACIAEDIRINKAGILFDKPLKHSELEIILQNYSTEQINIMKKNSFKLYNQQYKFNDQMKGLINWMDRI